MHNPFRIRPYQSSDTTRFFGRERDTFNLFNLVTSEKVVTIHADTGAGKSSLLNAGLIPLLDREGFLVSTGMRPREFSSHGNKDNDFNIWVYDALHNALLLQSEAPQESIRAIEHPEPTERLTNNINLTQWIQEIPGQPPIALCIDQLEEIFQLDVSTADRFLEQLGRLARNKQIWIILVIRNTHLAELLGYERYFPGGLRARFPLPLLSITEAKEIVHQTLAQANLTPETLKALTDLALMDEVIAQAASHSLYPRQLQGPRDRQLNIVLPLFLQIHCYRWCEEVLRGHSKSGSMSTTDREHSDHPLLWFIDQQITMAIRKAGGDISSDEEALRDWCEKHLTHGDYRKPAQFNESNLPIGAAQLAQLYLVTSLTKARVELSHDSFVSALKASNERYAAGLGSYLARRARAWRLNQRSKGDSASLLLPWELIRVIPSLRTSSTSEKEFFWKSLSAFTPVAISLAALLALAVSIYTLSEKQKKINNANINLYFVTNDIFEKTKTLANITNQKKCIELQTYFYQQAIPSPGLEQHVETLDRLVKAYSRFLAKPECLRPREGIHSWTEFLNFRTQDYLISSTQTSPRPHNSDYDLNHLLTIDGTAETFTFTIFPGNKSLFNNTDHQGHTNRDLLAMGHINTDSDQQLKIMLDRESETRYRASLFPHGRKEGLGRHVIFAIGRKYQNHIIGLSALRDGSLLAWKVSVEQLKKCFLESTKSCAIIELNAAISLGNVVIDAEIEEAGNVFKIKTDQSLLYRVLLPLRSEVERTFEAGGIAEDAFYIDNNLILVMNNYLLVIKGKSSSGSSFFPVGNRRNRPDEKRYTLLDNAADFNIATLIYKEKLYQVRRNGEYWLRQKGNLPKAKKMPAALYSGSDLTTTKTLLTNAVTIGKHSRIAPLNLIIEDEKAKLIDSPDFLLIEASNEGLDGSIHTWDELFENHNPGNKHDTLNYITSMAPVTGLNNEPSNTVVIGLTGTKNSRHTNGIAICGLVNGRIGCQGPFELDDKSEGTITAITSWQSKENSINIVTGYSSGDLVLLKATGKLSNTEITPQTRQQRVLGEISALQWVGSNTEFFQGLSSTNPPVLLIGTRTGSVLLQLLPNETSDESTWPPAFQLFSGTDEISLISINNERLFVGDIEGRFVTLEPDWGSSVIHWSCRILREFQRLEQDKELKGFCEDYRTGPLIKSLGINAKEAL